VEGLDRQCEFHGPQSDEPSGWYRENCHRSCKGDLNQKLLVEAKGEIGELADTINNMIDTLATFADQVPLSRERSASRENWADRLMCQGAAGTWGDLTDNVNRLAANLTTQLRAIANVATAVTKGI